VIGHNFLRRNIMTHIDLKALWNVAKTQICLGGANATVSVANLAYLTVSLAAGHPYIAMGNAFGAALSAGGFGLMAWRAMHLYNDTMTGPH
jgi:hypothetical protein